jgi:hypothetical protein
MSEIRSTNIDSNANKVEILKQVVSAGVEVSEATLVNGLNEALTRSFDTFLRNIEYTADGSVGEKLTTLEKPEERMKEFFEMNTEHIRSFLVTKISAKFSDTEKNNAVNVVTWLLTGQPPNLYYLMLNKTPESINTKKTTEKIPDDSENDEVTEEPTVEKPKPKDEIVDKEEIQKENIKITNDFFDSDKENAIKVKVIGKKRKEKFRQAMQGMMSIQADKLGIKLTDSILKTIESKLKDAGVIKKSGKWTTKTKKIEIATYNALIEIADNTDLKAQKSAIQDYFNSDSEKFVWMRNSDRDLFPILIHLAVCSLDKKPILNTKFFTELKKEFSEKKYLRRGKWRYPNKKNNSLTKVIQDFCKNLPSYTATQAPAVKSEKANTRKAKPTPEPKKPVKPAIKPNNIILKVEKKLQKSSSEFNEMPKEKTVRITVDPKNIESVNMTYAEFKEKNKDDEYIFVSGPLIHGNAAGYTTYTGGGVQDGKSFGNFRKPEFKDGIQIPKSNFDDNNGIVAINDAGEPTLYTYAEYTKLKDGAKTNFEASKFAFQNGPILLKPGINSGEADEDRKNNPHSPGTAKRKSPRVGMGWNENGKVIFVHTKELTNLYEFGKKMEDAGCVNAIYLDGAQKDAVGYVFGDNKNYDTDKGEKPINDSRRGFLIRKG